MLTSDDLARAAETVVGHISPGADVLVELWERERAAGSVLLSFDPNVRPALVGSREAAVAHVERFVAASHVVKASDEDLGWLYPDVAPSEAVARWATMGPSLVVMTRGADGSTVHAGGANTTHDVWRRGMHLSYVLGWLRTEENHFLTTPPDVARTLPRRAQELLGYAAHDAIAQAGGYLGTVDLRNPVDLLAEGTL